MIIVFFIFYIRILEAQRSKCYLYWPDVENQKLYFSSGHTGCLYAPAPSDRSNNSFSKFSSNNNVTPDFLIENIKCESNGNFAQTTLRITHLQVSECYFFSSNDMTLMPLDMKQWSVRVMS